MIETCRHRLISAALVALMASSPVWLAGCGGGGNVRPSAPSQPQEPPPAPPPEPRPEPTPAAKPVPPTQTSWLTFLTTDGGVRAHAQGYTGKGQVIAIMDNGFAPLNAGIVDRVQLALEWWETGADGNPPPRDITDLDRTNADLNYYFHGTSMGNIAAGTPLTTGGYALSGGLAPDAKLYLNAFGAEANQAAEGAYDGYTRLRALPLAMNRMLDAGVHIYSFSISGDDAFDSTSQWSYDTMTSVDRAFPKPTADKLIDVVNRGALLVWAAGNSTYDRPDGESRAPAKYPALEKGWITVVALDGKNPRVLASYSNQCGDAMAWCIAAPGDTAVPHANTTKAHDQNIAWLMNGTSSATPQVAGTAALVAEAYPWMTLPQVRASILTTSIDLGAPGVDATFGWGLLAADRAVNGPAWLTDDPNWAIGTFNVGSHHAVFSHDIAGPGALTMDGTDDGVLELTGYNTYAGGTTIKGGTLELPGLVSSDVHVEASGTLAGNGWIKADLVNAGGRVQSVADYSKVGYGLRVDGNYTASADAVTEIFLGYPMSIGGTATLAGTLEVDRNDTRYTPSATETLMYAGDVAGTFATVTTQSGLSAYNVAVDYAATTVTAKLSRKDGTAMSTKVTPVAMAAGVALEGALEKADVWSQSDYAGHAAFLDTAAKLLAAPSQQALDASIDSLSGQIHGTLTAVEVASSQQMDHAIALRQNHASRQTSLWVQAYGTNFGLAQSGYASARATGNGELVGVDIPVARTGTFGVLAGHARTRTHMDALAGRASERDTLIGAYFHMPLTGGTYLATRMTYARAKLRVQRSVLIGIASERLATERTDGVARITLEGGHRFGSVTPYLAVSALRITQDGFTETGAAGFGLTAPDQHQNVRLGELGVRWQHPFTWAGGASTLTGYAAWQHVLGGADLDFTAALAATPDARFTATGQSLARNIGRIGASVTTRINRYWGWSADANYRGKNGRFHAFGVNVGVRYRF